MHLELQLSNDPRALPSVRAFVRETLAQFPLSADDAAAIGEIVVEAVKSAIEHAYLPGEDGPIHLVIRESQGKLEVRVRDFGEPQDVAKLEGELHSSPARQRFESAAAKGVDTLVDEMHWLAFGPQGKALQLIKWLHVTHVAESQNAAAIAPFQDNVPLAREQQYAIEPLKPDDAVQVSRLMYRAYGNTYFNADVYYPERVVAQNATGAVLSYVARDEAGAVVGHCALEFDQSGPVAELGQAVIDPAHRGRGLLDRLKAALVIEAGQRKLVGWYADAVGVHTLTQKSNVHHGGRLSGVELGISPQSERFRGFDQAQPQRVTCLLYFHWLSTPAPRAVFVPTRHQGIVTAIYTNLECPVEFGPEAAAAGHGTLAIKVEPGAARAALRVDNIGADTFHAIVHARRELVERSGVAVVFVDLPVADAGCPALVEQLEGKGFGFAGIAPCFMAKGDALRMVYLVTPLAREPIKTFEPFADELTNYALAEQSRVRQQL